MTGGRMAEPLHAVDGYKTWVDSETSGGEAYAQRRARGARARGAVRRWGRAVLGWTVRPARLLPGLGAVACAVAGSWLLWGLGVALLVAVPFLLLLDARTPRS